METAVVEMLRVCDDDAIRAACALGVEVFAVPRAQMRRANCYSFACDGVSVIHVDDSISDEQAQQCVARELARMVTDELDLAFESAASGTLQKSGALSDNEPVEVADPRDDRRGVIR